MGGPAERDALLAASPEERLARLTSTLRRLVARALQIDEHGERGDRSVAADRSLLALGLDSLAAAELQGEIETRLGARLDLADLLSGSTLAELAAELAAQLARPDAPTSPAPTVPPVSPLSSSLSHGQRALWLLDRLTPGHPAYVIAGAARLRGALDVLRLRRALAALVARHPSLRATFPADGEDVAQRVRAEAGFAFVEEDAAAAGEAELAGRLAAAAYGPFDLARGPLLRVTVLHRGAEAPLLVLAVHHIVADFASLGVLLYELGALWRGEELPPLTVGYGDFVRRESARLAGEEGKRLWDFWQAELASPVPPLDLPTDRPRPPRPSLDGGSRTLRLPADLAARLAARARRAGATPFMAHLAAFCVLLHRLTDQEELRVGTPTAGRGAPDLASVVGYLVNPVPVRGDLRGDPPFGALLDRVRAATVAALAHQGLPFPLLAERLGGERDPSRSPLFQAMFVLYRERLPAERGLGGFAVGAAGSTLDLGGLVLESLALPRQSSQFDLTLLLAESGDGLAATLQFRRDLYDDTTAERLLAHAYATLLAAIGEGGDAGDAGDMPISALPLLAASERHQLAVEWNAAPWEVGGDERVHGPFERQAARTPEAIAVIDGGEGALSYGELERRASLLARALIARGVGEESIVGIFGEPSLALVAGLFAVLKAGGAYLPLDPAQPDERLAQIVADAGAALVLADERLAGRLRASVRVLTFGNPPEPRPTLSRPNVPPDTAAYLLYTSGTTGQPKGVVVPHRAVVNRLRFQIAADLTAGAAGARVLQRTRLGFDVSVVELFAPLWMGGTLVLTTPEGQQDPAYLARRIAGQQITNLNLPPALFPALLADPAFRGAAGLRRVVTGADRVPGDLPQRFFAAFAGAPHAPRLFARYGPTEATVSVSEWLCQPEPLGPSVPLGRPIAGTRFHLLDRQLRPLPPGVPGELCIAGICLARGYLGRPEITAAAFVPDPFSASGGRLYRTGDLARQRADGVVEFLGRIDRQVKIRGFRLEPGEIEAVLCRHPEVAAAAVVDQDEPATGGKRLVAYVVARPGFATADLAGCRDFLADRLPAYMVPAAFVLLERLPWNANGKLDRAALPAPDWQPTGEHRQAPRTPVEEILAGLWAELFGRDQVGADDDFFALGGHSLLGMRLLSRLRAAFGVELPLGALFAAPLLADFASRVEAAISAGVAGGAGAIPPLVALPRAGPLPLSFAQQRLWFLAQLEPGSPLYNLPGALDVEGPLDGSVLARCLAEIVRRHETLRTVFAAPDGVPVQVIREPSSFALPVVDLSGLAAGARAALARDLTAAEAVRPFDLGNDPPFRGLLLRLAAGASAAHVAALTLHHIASDGWSLDLFGREIAALYPAFVRGLPSPLPELPVQYADFALWQRSWLTGEVLEGEIAFWRRQLAGLPPLLDLPTDRPRSAAQSFRGAARAVRLPHGLTRQIQALARRSGATLFMVLLAGFQGLLARWSGQEDLAVGAPVAGRTRREVEPLIGFFVNTLVLRGDLSGAPALQQLLGRVRETALSAYRHQDVPFDKLAQELAPERSRTRTPLFQVLFVLQNAPGESLTVGDLRLRRRRVETGTAKFDLTLNLMEHDGTLAGTVEYATDLFDRASVDRLIAGYARLVAGAVAEPDRSLVDLPLLSAAELHQLQSEWNPDAMSEGAPGAALVERFESWAERTPDAIALLAPGEALTYSELDARADRLAGRLRALGVTLDARVGLCAERSPAMIVAVLGILKAGAAYLPLDPEYPRERLAFMVEDARPRVLLAEERLLGRLPETAATLLLLDAGESLSNESAEPRPGPATQESLAYVIYTSGSTGRPKGVMVHHQGWSNLAEAQRRLFGLGPGDRVLQFAALGFDASAWEISLAFGAGATLVLGPRERRLASEELAALLRQCTFATLPPAVLATLTPEATPGLETLVVAGEACPLELARRWAMGRRLVNAYGPTEATVCATAELYDGGDRLPIGRPLAGTEAWVLDAWGNPAPLGVVGELYLGGSGLARGYLSPPERTAQSFVPHAFAARPGERLYRTGDLALRRPDGGLELRGRLDRQVKIRGFRVELGEIEAVLSTLPGVRAAAVLAHESTLGGRRLVAYVVGNSGDIGDDVLRRALSARLPGHMVPAAFVALPALPLTPNGKLAPAALPAPASAATAEGELAPPRDPREELLAGLWAELFSVERVGIHQDFFALGGHSLLATRLAARIKQALDVELPVRELFAAPTVAALAARLGALQSQDHGAPPPLLPAPAGAGPAPLSFAQERLWLLAQIEPGSPAYNVPMAVRLDGRLAVPALAAALRAVVSRHEALRTVFAVSGESAFQRALPAEPVPLPAADLSALPDGAAELARLARSEARLPFDLARGPLLRARLLALGREEHVLLLTVHHIAWDGWSTGIFLRELAALYGAEIGGSSGEPLPEPRLQYADYARWQRAWRTDERLAGALAYWRARLLGAPAETELPADRPRKTVSGGSGTRGGQHLFGLDADLVAALGRLGRELGATLFMLLTAAFNLLLHRLTGQDDLVIGFPIAHRSPVETEEMIGVFVNTLVLRSTLVPRASFAALVAGTRETTLGAYERQELPFERLVAELAPERSLNRSPLFQVILALQNTPEAPLSLPGLVLTPLALDAGLARFDLSLSLAPRTALGAGLAGRLGFSRELFDATTAGRWAASFRTLLAAAVCDPHAAAAHLPLLAAAEAAQVVREWNDTARPEGAAPRETLHELFALQAARTPGAPAVRCEGEQLTYRELDRRADLLALALRREGVGPEGTVGLLAAPSLAAIVGLLAVLKAGGAYVPLDPGAPAERLAGMIADAGIEVVLTRDEFHARLPAGVRGVDLTATAAGELSATSMTADNLAYVLYTSGSSGQPKGVAVTHGSVVRYTLAITERLGLGPGSHFAMVQPLTVDSCVTAIFPPLLSGGCLHVLPRERALVAPALAEAFRLHPIDCLKIAPSHLAALSAAGESAALLPRRWLIVGGEPSQLSWLRELQAAAPSCALFNHYGPTEATVGMLLYRVGGEGAGFSPISPVGRPLAGAQAYLLDEQLQPVPLGSRGTLYIGGACLARGYLGRPDLTAERFVPDPFGPPGARLYDSGDRMRHTARGDLVFLGRLDQQIKIRGFRVELGEIEAALARHPAVGEVVVRTWEEAPGREGLAAYVVARGGGAAPAFAELRAFLAEKLPDYMLPSALVSLPALPRTPHGKLDLKALPAPSPADAAAIEGSDLAPRTPTEELLAGVYADLLGRERVGAGDGFFELGGHSLLATRLLSRIRHRFGVELALREVFEQPTVEGLARRIEAADRQRTGRQAPPIERLPRSGDLPLSFAQQRLWFLAQLAPESPRYNVPLALALFGRLDVPTLARSLGEVVRRHEVLRTRFPTVEGRPVQVIAPGAPPGLPTIDLGRLPVERRESAAGGLAAAEAQRPFDLATGPLLRAALLRLGEEEHRVLLTLHHVASDAWSREILVRELGELYRAFVAGRESPLPELPVQYADFAAWQRSWLLGKVLDAELAYWRSRLQGAPPLLALPLDRPRQEVWSDRGAIRPLSLPGPLSQAVTRLAREAGATSFMVLLSGLLTLLARWTGQLDLPVGTPIAGRTHLETEPLIGFFVNTLVLRVDLSAAPDFAALLSRVREVALDAYLHQDLPFEKLVEELQPERSLAHAPLFQVMFVLQNAPPGRLALPGLSVAPLRVAPASAKFDLTFALFETAEGLAGAIEYHPDLFDGTTVARLAAGFESLLGAALGEPRQPIAQLPVLSPAQRQQLRVEWNDTAVPYPLDRGLHEWIEEQVRRTPEAVAVVAEGESLTYRALNARANRLARRLRRRGVGPETVVAISVERSLGLMVGLLAILKAGGAYLPLDPDDPPERRRFLQEDARAALLLTSHEIVRGLSAEPGPRAGRDLAVPFAPDNLAYVIYTSGTTGKPKGVMNRHRGIVNRLLWMQERYGLEPDDRVLQKTPTTFDVSVWELFWPLSTGATLVMARPGEHRDPAYLWRTLAEQGITTLHFVPSMLRAFLDDPRLDPAGLPLRRVMASGEALGHDLQERYVSHLYAPLHNLYGPTEAAVDVTHWSCDRRDGRPLVPIGRPLANTRILLLDRNFEEVPIGATGELHIGGVQVARGYLGRPDLTAARFVPDPTAAEPGARLYRTGDLARHLADGAIDYLGRNDHQVKLRGFRIELGEVEAALAALPAVQAAAAAVRQSSGGPRLVAYVVPREPSVTLAGLRRELARHLSEFMLPGGLVLLARLPLTASGKLDRRALPAPATPEASESAGSGALRTPAEELLAGIWAELLGIERVGSEDNFFALGGHSLLATRVIARLRQLFAVELTLRDLFEAPTVSALAARAMAAKSAGRTPAPPLVPLPPAFRAGRLPLSFAQERLWFLDQLEPGSATYNMPLALRFAGPLKPAALAAALTEVVRRHESLRTTFALEAGAPRQEIHPPARWPLPRIDLGGLAGAEREREAARLAREEAARPFALATGPLLRTLLLHLGEEEHLQLATLHHIAGDGWSAGVLTRELGALYAALVDRSVAALPALPVQYADFAVWQRSWLGGPALEAELAHWRRTLAGAPPLLALPADRPRPTARSGRGAGWRFRLPGTPSAALAALGRQQGATPFMTFLALFANLVGRHAGQDDVVLGTPVAGRTHAETEGLIGCFVNTLVLRLDLAGEPTFAALLGRVREAVLAAHAHQELPFEKLVLELTPERSLDRSPLFQVMFTWNDESPVALDLPGVAASLVPLAVERSQFDLSLNLAPGDPGIAGRLQYATDLFDGTTIGRLAGHLAVLLEGVAADPACRAGELALLTAAERAQLLVEWGSRGEALPGTRVHVLDRRLRPVPIGVPGELLLGGRGLVPGDLGRADSTAERFVPDPFGPAGERLYRTDDLVRFRPDGNLELLGRTEDPVKTPGFRVEPGQVEAPLLSQRAAAEPRSWAEEIVAAIWADVLGVQQIDREASFFDLGGHSLLATRVMARLRAVCGVELPLRELFAEPTVAGLAARLERARQAPGGRTAPPLVPVGRERPLPLSYAQQRLWFLDQLEPGSALYNLPAALRFTGRLAAAALERSLTATVRRHEALRTRFATLDGEPVQVIEDLRRLPLARIDLAGLGAAARESEARRLAAAEARRPFDLGRAPLLRAALLALDGEEHVLLLTVHHIASDGWSQSVLIREMAELYGAALAGRPPALPELPVQYADFAGWQRAWLAGEVLAEQLAYWRERLAGPAGGMALDLPIDRPRPKAADSRGARRKLRLSTDLATALAALGRREGATLFMVLLAAFQAHLGRFTGQRRLVVGSPIANRTRREIEGLVGFFVNTLALAGDLDGDPTFLELLERTREACLGAYAHQDLPFEKLVEELTPERDLARSALFQVMLVLQNAPREEVALPGLLVAPFEIPVETARFDLTLTVTPEREGEGLAASLGYPTALFDATTGERLLERFARLLAGLVAAPESKVWDLPLLAAAEATQVVREWNDTALSEAGAPRATLHELFAAQAARTPGAPAVRCEGKQLTYRDLDRRAAVLARTLQREGVGPEVAVGLLAEPSVAAIVGLLAVLEAGGAYVPLDPGAPAERLAGMIADAGIEVVLARDEFHARLPAGVRGVDLAALPAPAGGGLHPISVAAENLAYVLFTSGSTGRPKGVAVTHGSVVGYTLAIAERLGLEPGAHFAMVQPLTVDSCVTAIFPPLLTGGCLHVLPRERALVAQDLAEAFRRYPIDCLKIAPSHLAALYAAGESAALLPRRWLIVGGEPSQLSWLRELQAAAPSCAIFNHYGPTEATVGMLMFRVGGEGAGFSPISPVGRPLAGAQAYLLDGSLQPVPPGSRGTLYIGGACLARGYLGRPELTAERFVPDPFGPPGARLYDSGDRMRHTAQGDLVFLGRLDQQIKVRGFRVELGEIEAALARHPAVGEVVVRTWEEAPGREGLAAYVVSRGGGAAPALAELRAFLSAKLPDYMLPSALVALPSLPRTPHGKLDLKALPAPSPADALATEGTDLALRTPTEELLAGIYADLLGRERVAAGDGFFELGGHSLLATRLLSRIRHLFGVELALREIFEQPTVAGLARRIEAADRRRTGREAPPIERIARSGDLPLSFAQQRLWFLAQLAPESPRYNVPLALALSGRLDVPALAQSLGEVVRRHEVLRTRFPTIEGRPLQVISHESPAGLPLIDLGGLPAARRESVAYELAAAEAGRPFDLATGPLLRAALLRVGEEEHRALLTLHHVVSDAWSREILVRELGELYRAFSAGREAPLPALPVQYADFAAWQQSWLAGEILSSELAYWRSRLADAPPLLALPLDRPRQEVWSDRGALHPLSLPGPTSQAVTRLAREAGATPFMVLLSAFLALLARWTGQLDLSLGTPIAGRNHLEIEPLIGFFVNTLVLRVDLAETHDFAALLARVRDVALDAYLHQDLPFEKLVEELQPERSLAHAPLFQALFVLQNAPPSSLALPGLSIAPLRVAPASAKFDLTLALADTPDGLSGAVEYHPDLFDGTTIARLAAAFETLLRAALGDPQRTLAQLPLLSPAQRHQLRVEWNGTAAPYPLDRGLHEGFEEQVRRTPEAVAVVAEEGSLTYGALNARANRLARRLRRRGVGPETVVAISVERSLALMVGLLAILKAGGAYLPLDPDDPPERRRFLLEDARVPLLLTTREITRGLSAEPGPRAGRELGIPMATDHLAYVIYTSGTTGKPKGVMCHHRGIVNRLLSVQERYGLQPDDRVLQKTPTTFDVSVGELFWPLSTGATLVMARPGGHRDPDYLWQTIAEQGVTTLNFVPSTLRAFLDDAGSAQLPLRRVMTIGEALGRDLEERYFSHLEAPLHNLYGPTEAAVDVTHWSCDPTDGRTLVPIGRPLANTHILLLDRDGQEVPIGATGELHIGGVQVARGYLDRPDLTADRFVPDPTGAEPGARLYRTGDLARHLADGALDFLGRNDQQVKLRGFRIELGEVEAALGELPSVQAAVVAVREGPGGPRLVAYVVPREPGVSAPTLAGLRRELARILPEFMLPGGLVLRERLPLTASGKLDRKELLRTAPDPEGPAGEPYVAPRTSLELRLVRLWEELLARSPVGVRESFFALGGHSLLAVRLVARLRAALSGREVAVADLFQAPTVEQLARRLEEGGAALGSPLVPLQPRGARAPFFGVHPIGGGVMRYFGPLAERLGPDQPFYALEAADPARQGEAPHPSIEELATRYLAALREVRPHGPYFLGGGSYGGIVAFEMAQQLAARGEEVTLLALFDTILPDTGPAAPAWDEARFCAQMAHWLARQEGATLDLTPDELRGLPRDAMLARVLDRLRAARLVGEEIDLPWMRRYLAGYTSRQAAALAYRPRFYPGEIELFRVARADPAYDPALGWGELAREVRIHPVPGDHETMVREPHVQELAARLRRLLERSGARVVPEAGVEPASPRGAVDFESTASAIPPLRQQP